MNKKTGFTLAELLIVVAIIAILVAIGIPAFSTAMERSRETVDLSNIRGAYAEFMAGTLGGNANTGYYKINVKQRNCADWVIDCSGFLSNIVKVDSNKYVTPTEMPTDDNFKTGDVWVKFTTMAAESSGTNETANPSEKPRIAFVKTNNDNTQPNGVTIISTPTNYSPSTPTTAGLVAKGDGWYLTYEVPAAAP
ncbi:MAG: prepilin-type N-terminal cleavage/methylation domain-containing protein [Oscillibacter sp.]|nr:prepilin-type N-terminal cleavage/methylation domain-containing protein [Oscillibacter sp.]